jgi:hypothetical protein
VRTHPAHDDLARWPHDAGREALRIDERRDDRRRDALAANVRGDGRVAADGVIARADDPVRLPASLQDRRERTEDRAPALDVGCIVEIQHQRAAAMRQPLDDGRTDERRLHLHPHEVVRAQTCDVDDASTHTGEHAGRRPDRLRAIVESGERPIAEERTDIRADPELSEQRYILEKPVPRRGRELGEGRQREDAHVSVHSGARRRSAVRPST